MKRMFDFLCSSIGEDNQNSRDVAKEFHELEIMQQRRHNKKNVRVYNGERCISTHLSAKLVTA